MNTLIHYLAFAFAAGLLFVSYMIDRYGTTEASDRIDRDISFSVHVLCILYIGIASIYWLLSGMVALISMLRA